MLRPISGFDFGYTSESVEWLEGYIERLRQGGALREMRNGLINTCGSFLGECIIRNYGGAWVERDGEWAIAFDERNCVFPFVKVARQMDNGLEDSIAGLYRTIPTVFAEHVRQAE